ncbi:hypothetical protein NEDG_01255 [Nematocida displodere]|uniref:Transmembrane protein n=1 Tax=Nematocida displodere TaxID=1805483 RepID=A0A177EDE0_9MICR|nr:hypothetical protein NEDG_01255 [Nematocida displodere]
MNLFQYLNLIRVSMHLSTYLSVVLAGGDRGSFRRSLPAYIPNAQSRPPLSPKPAWSLETRHDPGDSSGSEFDSDHGDATSYRANGLRRSKDGWFSSMRKKASGAFAAAHRSAKSYASGQKAKKQTRKTDSLDAMSFEGSSSQSRLYQMAEPGSSKPKILPKPMHLVGKKPSKTKTKTETKSSGSEKSKSLTKYIGGPVVAGGLLATFLTPPLFLAFAAIKTTYNAVQKLRRKSIKKKEEKARHEQHLLSGTPPCERRPSMPQSLR